MALMRWTDSPTMSSAIDRFGDLCDSDRRFLSPLDYSDTYYPVMESYVKGEEMHLRAEVPGIKPKDIHVNVTDGHLCVSGERKEPDDIKEGCCCFEEMTYGSFERCFTIPENIDRDKIKAKTENGILDITIPLPESVRPHEIKVE